MLWGGYLSLYARSSSQASSKGSSSVSSQVSSIEIYFPVGSSKYDPSFRSNGRTVARFVRETAQLSRTLTSGRVKVTFSASASPDGDSALNSRLSTDRLASAIDALVRAGLSREFFSSSNSVSDFVGVVSLESLAEKVEGSSYFTSDEKAEILEILSDPLAADKDKMLTLRSAEGGRYWKILAAKYFPAMRSFRAIVRVVEEESLQKVSPSKPLCSNRAVAPLPPLARRGAAKPAEDAVSEDAAQQEWSRKLTIKTNAPFWALMIANGGVEVDLTQNLSFNLPVYFGTLDYFTSTVKFRTLALQPELRWNFSQAKGLFLGAHFSLCYFNFAANANYRIQDRGGNTPMLGGGLTLGYKLHFPKNPKWGVEFALGAGAYRFDYDRFVNEENGPYVDTVNRTYIGLDNASISFFYEFDLGRGKRK